jgi:hypothetical protein
MKKIKFRVWDGDRNEMIEWEELRGVGGWDSVLEPCPSMSPSLFLMQFTGLYDKNGKEIYEGDILTDHEEYDGGKETRLVCKIGETEDKRYGVMLNYYWTEKECCAAIITDFEYLEVIGNIYKNPELVKDCASK